MQPLVEDELDEDVEELVEELVDELVEELVLDVMSPEVEVLVEGPARRAGQVSGKTESFKTVVFEGTADTNSFVTVRVTDCTQKTLIGRAV